MMRNVEMPDISGFRLEHALQMLSSSGYEKVSIYLTAAPRQRGAAWNCDSRVVRQKKSDDGTVELLVCNVLTGE